MTVENPWNIVAGVFMKLINRAANRPERLSVSEWIVFRVWLLVGEVSNGGFDQYFFNSAGNHAGPVADALKAIGDAKALAVFKKALAVFPGGPSPDRDLRWKQLQEMPKARRKKFGVIDREFWDCNQATVEKLAAYIKANKRKIQPKKERRGRRYE